MAFILHVVPKVEVVISTTFHACLKL